MATASGPGLLLSSRSRVRIALGARKWHLTWYFAGLAAAAVPGLVSVSQAVGHRPGLLLTRDVASDLLLRGAGALWMGWLQRCDPAGPTNCGPVWTVPCRMAGSSAAAACPNTRSTHWAVWRCTVMRSPPCSRAVIGFAPDPRLTRDFVLSPAAPIQLG